MREGKHIEGSHVLRAKIKMDSQNMLMRDPVCIEYCLKTTTEQVANGVFTQCMIGLTENQIILNKYHIHYAH